MNDNRVIKEFLSEKIDVNKVIPENIRINLKISINYTELD